MLRPYRMLAALGGAFVFLAFSSLGKADSSSCATPDTNATITTCYFDLTASPSASNTTPSAVLNGGIFNVPAQDGDLGKGFIVGTGVFQPFVRIQEPGNGNHASDGIEAGYNTDGRDGV